MTKAPAYSSPAVEQAWQAYLQGVEDVRGMLLGHPWAQEPAARGQALYLVQQLQAEAFRVAVAPHPDYPRILPLFEPLMFSWGVPSPDFIHGRLYLDGRRTYRLRVKRNNSHFVAIQVMNSHFTIPPEQLRVLGDFDLDAFRPSPDGTVEIILSAKKGEGNWIPLDPATDRNFVLFREVITDWVAQTASEMDIEVIDDLPRAPAAYDEADMIRKLEGAVRFMKAMTGAVALKVPGDTLRIAGGPNRFAKPEISGKTAASAAGGYDICVYELAPDDALIVEFDPPRARFWNIQLSDAWNQAIDYTFHHASMNMAEASVDSDGKIRIVVSLQDPGVRNWLDPDGVPRGTVFLRTYHTRGVVAPEARLVKLADLDRELPVDVARTTTAERAAIVARRRHAMARRRHHAG